ncbi:MAG TPA: methyltransferase domain-containing protein [Armatimonadota bacterium]|jgi:2-polyprenyl-3-methyl-5-hydroxy-6-metoxy-1,4-benzoquinol methylase
MSGPKDGLYAEKGEAYFDQPRIELVELVPPDRRRLLDVGCGAGATGMALKQKLGPDAKVFGVEIDPRAAEVARGRLDGVLSVDLEAADVPSEWLPLDGLLLGDVLEHLVDPWSALRRMREWLTPDGVVVASLPNLSYWKALVPLILKDEFVYQASGVMDRSHLRFFTRRTVARLFEDAGFRVDLLRGNALGTKGELLAALSLGTARRFLTTQYHVVARRS